MLLLPINVTSLHENENTDNQTNCATVFLRDFWFWINDDSSRKTVDFLIDSFISEDELENLQKPFQQLENNISWYANFGASVLFLDSCYDEFNLKLVALDNWQYACVNKKSQQETNHTAICYDSTLMDLPTIFKEDKDTLLSQALLLIEQQERDKKRSGYQTTPAFIQEVFQVACTMILEEKQEKSIQEIEGNNNIDQEETIEPKGGTTDVGEERHTSFPLVTQSLKQLMNQCEIDNYKILFDKLMVMVDVYSFIMMKKNTLSKISTSRIDGCVELIDSVHEKLVALDKQGIKVTHIAQFLSEGRDKLKLEREACWRLKTKKPRYNLPDISSIDIPTSIESWEIPNIREIDYLEEQNLSTIRFNTKLNIGFAQTIGRILFSSTKNIDKFLHRHQSSPIHIVSYTEQFLFQFTDFTAHVNKGFVLKDIKELYDTAVSKLLLMCEPVDAPNIKSRQILIHLICYCLADAVVVHNFPFCEDFGVSIDFSVLKYLVLRQKETREVQQKISDYLKARTNEKPLFHLNYQAHTLNMVKKYMIYGDKSQKITLLFDQHILKAQDAITKRWDEICEKKKEVERLEYEISRLKAKIQSYQYNYEDTARKRNLESNLYYARLPPDNLIFPLPEMRTKAYQVLFFLYFMPEEMKNLFYFSCEANNLLFDAPQQDSTIKNPWDNNTLHRYTNNWSQLPNYFFIDGTRVTYKKLECVTQIYSKREGVYFQDRQDVTMVFRNKTITQKSFQRSTNTLLEHLTPLISNEKLQQTLNVFDGEENLSRSNFGPANQQYRPIESWTKRQYLQFCSLRSHPNKQLCVLLEILQHFIDGESVISHPDYQTVLRHMLFHTGPLQDDPGIPLWSSDIRNKKYQKKLTQTMAQCADRISELPREHQAMKFLLECCAYFSQWIDSIEDITMKLVKSCIEWGKMFADEISYEESRRVKAIQCLYNCYALWGFCLGPTLKEAHVFEIYKLLAKINLGFLFKDYADDEVKRNIEKMHYLCIQTIANRNRDILSILKNVPDILTEGVNESEDKDVGKDICSQVLSEALDAILPGSNGERRKLKWSIDLKIGDSVYYAMEESKMYHFNILDGAITVDGNPIGRLPRTITEHSVFKDCFGDRNFEVALEKGLMVTISPITGFLYKFAISGDDILIREKDKDGNELDIIPRELFDCFPICVWEHYSFWYSAAKQRIVIRSLTWNQRELKYILCVDTCQCYKVPYEFRNEKLEDHDLNSYERLVSPKLNSILEQRVNVLSKFELKQFIHTLITPKNGVKHYLPRFDLEFDGNNSLQYSGFHLASQQLLEDVLLGFTNYLVLENNVGHETIIIPHCSFEDMLFSIQSFTLKIPQDSKIKMDTHTYSIHPRFRNLLGQSRDSLLFLAAIYMKIDCFIKSPTLHNTPSEEALSIIRAAFQCSPLTEREINTIRDIQAFSSGSPAVYILVQDLLEFCLRIRPLYSTDAQNDGESLSIFYENRRMAADQRTIYRRQVKNPYFPIKSRLTPEEEKRILGSKTISLPSKPVPESLPIKDIPIPLTFVEKYEKFFISFVEEKPSPLEGKKFPLELETEANEVAKELFDEEMHSWNVLIQQKQRYYMGESLLKIILLRNAESFRQCLQQLEEYLTASLSYRKDAIDSNLRPVVALRDFLRIGCDKSFLYSSQFNPGLSMDCRIKLRDACILWMKLCVLDDKLQRIQTIQGDTKIIQELTCVRNWDAYKYPEWLAFEVEQRIQIRPLQYTVCKSLLDSSESVAQLNMGQGKTRVILPMLIMAWSQLPGSCTRVHILSPLLSETLQYFQSSLSQSVLNIKIFELPYHRQIEMNRPLAVVIRNVIQWCSDEGHALFIAPEHRMSLEMRMIEYQEQAEWKIIRQALQRNYRDIFDEVDVSLPNWELVFSMGSDSCLDSGKERWQCIAAVLLLFRFPNKQLQEILDRENVSERRHSEVETEEFMPVRLIQSKEFKEVEPELRHFIASEICHNPPQFLQWIKDHPNAEELQEYIENPEMAHIPALGENMQWKNYVLILRGLLAGGILFHVLQKRNRVHFGISHRPQQAKRIAVPFRAADCPAERAEFSHLDIAVTYTLLAYYYEGLSMENIRIAITTLLELGIETQNSNYEKWIRLSSKRLPPAVIQRIDKANKLDLTNQTLCKVLYDAFHKNPLVINFWLINCVLPSETKVYPQKSVGSGWNLACNKNHTVIGFSGTNDNKRLLPLPLKQIPMDEPQLVSTNATMIHYIRSLSTIIQLEAQNPQRDIIDNCIHEKDILCLIDAGGLMAGKTNYEVAEELLRKGKSVVFFHLDIATWVVMDERKIIKPLHLAPKPSSECFVYFDESRCRGADIKMKDDAVALLTIAPKMKRDALTQAAGRMRGLHLGQKLKLAVLPEVARLLKDLTTDSLLSWCINNVATYTIDGLFRWAEQGIIFASRQNCATFQEQLLDETYELDYLYQGSQQQILITEAAEKKVSLLFSGSPVKSQNLIESILERINRYAAGHTTLGTLEEQCERELELAKEVEHEVEKVTPQRPPSHELDWDYQEVTSAISMSDISCITNVSSLQKFVRQILPGSRTCWSENIFATENFKRTVQLYKPSGNYLRNISGILRLPGSTEPQFLLLSERETDKLKGFWDSIYPAQLLFYKITKAERLPLGIHLFAGKTTFPESHLSQLKTEMENPDAEEQVMNIIRLRQLSHYYEDSDLAHAVTAAHNKRGYTLITE